MTGVVVIPKFCLVGFEDHSAVLIVMMRFFIFMKPVGGLGCGLLEFEEISDFDLCPREVGIRVFVCEFPPGSPPFEQTTNEHRVVSSPNEHSQLM